jgi:hypothetical protein
MTEFHLGAHFCTSARREALIHAAANSGGSAWGLAVTPVIMGAA